MASKAASDRAPRDGFLLGDWLVEPGLNRLSQGGRSREIEPRTMDVLVHLARHAGRVLRREEIIAAVWELAFVADATLSHAISEVRRALGDDARRPRFVETISKRGYRLIATVSGLEETGTDLTVGGSRPAVQAPSMTAVPASIAVLPFADMSPGHDQKYFCDGVAEEIINALGHIEGLRVAARTSAFAFRERSEDAREIGRKLAVAAVLEGSVRKAGDRLRVTVQLIDVADGYHLWSERFDRGGEDIFAIQDEIALGVVSKLRIPLAAGEAGTLGRRRAGNLEAHDLLLNGRFLLNRGR